MNSAAKTRPKRQSTKTHHPSPQKLVTDNFVIQTPERKKRVRFSDPFPRASTGLTPFLGRSRICTSLPSPPPMLMSPRRTAPSSSSRNRLRKAKSERWSSPLTTPTDETFSGVVQFKPIRQVLDDRSARRIRRHGIGEEVEKWEQSRKEEAKRSRAEICQLRAELEALKKQHQATEPNRAHVEPSVISIEDQANFSMAHSEDPVPAEVPIIQVPATVASEDDDDATIPFSDVDLNHSGFRGLPDKFNEATESEASTVIADSEDELRLILPTASKVVEFSRMLEINKGQHERLISKLEEYLPDECDPAEFEAIDAALDTALTTLTMAESYASDSWAAFEILDNEVKELGFPGDDAQEMLAELKQQFRQARLELEYTNPGDHTFGFDNQKLLNELIRKIRVLKKSMEAEKREHYQQETQLLAYGSRLKKRLEAAQSALKIVAQEDVQKDTSISRLQSALDSYRHEVSGLEKVIEELDVKHRASMNDLHGRLLREQTRTRDSEQDVRQMREDIARLQGSLKQANATIASLQASKMSLEILVNKQKASQSGDVEAMQAEVRNLLTKVNDLRAKQVSRDKAAVPNLFMELPTPPTSSAPGTPTCDTGKRPRRRYDSGFGILPEVEGEDDELSQIA